MPLVMRNAVFYHLPRTAGTWIRAALSDQNIPYRVIGEKHGTFRWHDAFPLYPVRGGLENEYPSLWKNKIHFFCVRDPCSWYLSWYTYVYMKLQTRYKPNRKRLLEKIGGKLPDWEEFVISRVIQFPDGWMSRTIDFFTDGLEDNGLQVVVIRTENLIKELCSVLRMAGISHDKSRLLDLPAINCNDYEEMLPDNWWSDKLRHKIAKAEKNIYKKYY